MMIKAAYRPHVILISDKREFAFLDDFAPLVAVGFVDHGVVVFIVMSLVAAVAPVRWAGATTEIVSGDILCFAQTHRVSVVLQ